MAKAPMDILFDKAEMKCTICGASSAQGCECWTSCRCGYTYLTGTECTNPRHAAEKSATNVAQIVANTVIARMKDVYPEPMKAASGGFVKTLRVNMEREITSMLITAWENSPAMMPDETPIVISKGLLSI